jgi:hypothetical protein
VSVLGAGEGTVGSTGILVTAGVAAGSVVAAALVTAGVGSIVSTTASVAAAVGAAVSGTAVAAGVATGSAVAGAAVTGAAVVPAGVGSSVTGATSSVNTAVMMYSTAARHRRTSDAYAESSRMLMLPLSMNRLCTI